DGRAIRLYRQAGRQVVRDENGVRARRQRDGIPVRQIEQKGEDTDVDVREIADPLAEHRGRVAREAVAPLEHDDVERLLRAHVLANELLDAARELFVVQDGELDVEDGGLLGTR